MAENQTTDQDKLRRINLAKAQRARINLLSASAQEELDTPASPELTLSSAVDYTDRLFGEVNEGMISFMPQNIKDKFHEWGIGSVPGREIGGAVGQGLQYTGMALPMVIGLPAYGNATMNTVKGYPGVIRGMIDDISKFAINNPKTYLAGETLSAFGAGAAGEMADNAELGPAGQLMAEFAGSMLGGAATIGPRSFKAGKQALMKNLLPFTDEGGSIRAAQQTQARAGGQAENYAQRLESTPEGVTPAQWIGDERLMSQEARLLADNPELQQIVKNDLQEARIAAQESLVDVFGKPRTRQDWEKSVLERVAPEGVEIQPGMTDEMLNQTYDSFKPLYDGAKGHQVGVARLESDLINAPNDPEIIAPDFERKAVSEWAASQITALKNQIVDGEITSDALLEFRSKIRDQRRSQTSRGREERADLLGTLESQITQRLNDNLPEGAIDVLRQADSQYRKYKVVETAIFNAADSNLTPEDLSRAIQMGGLTSNSRYARGADEVTQELRRVALSGRSTEEVLGDPQRAAFFVRDLSGAEKQAVHADFTQTLFNRAKGSSRDATEGGLSLISGEKLMKDLADNKEVMQRLGMSNDEIGRLRTMAETIETLGKKAPQAAGNLFEDGPASILQLVAAISGAKSGQRMAGQGLGSSLVLAQFMSNKARGTLARLTSDQAERLMEDAVTDPKLYQTLLTRNIVERDIKERAAYLESWLLASAYNHLEEQQ